MLAAGFKKVIIFDMDGVFNRRGTPSPARLYVNHLVRHSSALSVYEGRILRDMAMLESEENFQPYAEDLSRVFKIAGLRKSLHDDACRSAARSLMLAPSISECAARLRRMAYEPYVLSASPSDLVSACSERIGLDPAKARSSVFDFEGGVFKELRLNLGRKRSQNRDDIMQSSVDSRYGVEMMVDDNPVTGGRIVKQGWSNIYMWLNKPPVMVGNVGADLRYVRDDYNRLVERVKMLERGLSVIVTMDESSYRSASDDSREALYWAEESQTSTGQAFWRCRDNVVRYVNSYVDKMAGIFSYGGSGIKKTVDGISRSKIEDQCRLRIMKFIGSFYRLCLETRCYV